MSDLVKRLWVEADESPSGDLLLKAAAEIERLTAALAAAEESLAIFRRDYVVFTEDLKAVKASLAAAGGANELLRVEAGNATAARKEYESAWRQSEAALAVAGRERDDARAEVERLRRERDSLKRQLEGCRKALDRTPEFGPIAEQIVRDFAGQAASPPQPAEAPAAIVVDMDTSTAHLFANCADAEAWRASRQPQPVGAWPYYECDDIEWHPAANAASPPQPSAPAEGERERLGRVAYEAWCGHTKESRGGLYPIWESLSRETQEDWQTVAEAVVAAAGARAPAAAVVADSPDGATVRVTRVPASGKYPAGYSYEVIESAASAPQPAAIVFVGYNEPEDELVLNCEAHGFASLDDAERFSAEHEGEGVYRFRAWHWHPASPPRPAAGEARIAAHTIVWRDGNHVDAFESREEARAFMDKHGATFWMNIDPAKYTWHPAAPAAPGEAKP